MNLLNKKYISVDRAINEFRSGRPIIIDIKKQKWIFFVVEYFKKSELLRIINKNPNNLVAYITNKKASALKNNKLFSKECVGIKIKFTDINWLKSIHKRKLNYFDKKKFSNKNYIRSPRFIDDIIDLAKHAKMVPCLIGYKIYSIKNTDSIMKFDYLEIRNQNKIIVESTKLVSQSRLPLKTDHNATIKIYKSFVGGLEHIVLKIGSPDKKKSVNLRIQSVCLTGEIFHSMKCDCKDQLHQSIDYISSNGGGYIIHLDQEGRGIGLINKIKAYDLQFGGMDTFDADTTMGFLGEERDFKVAVKILKNLKIKNVNLITNNQDKIKILKRNNIKIQKLIPTYSVLNKFNVKYLSTRIQKMNYKIKLK